MKKSASLWMILPLAVFMFIHGSCRVKTHSRNTTMPGITVETEEIAYVYTPPQNGSGPFWCRGSSILARNNEDVFLSGIETLYAYTPDEKLKGNYMYHKTVNNIRWVLFKRESDGWKLQQADEKERTREPSPIGLLSDGRLLMSVNPTIDMDRESGSTLNQPQILEFLPDNSKGSFKTLMPEWNANPRFNEHSYRTFSVDRENNEFILFQNIGYTHSEWAFCSKTGEWTTGQLPWPLFINDSITPFKSKHNRVLYPEVFLRNREVHFFGNSSVNKWARMQNLEAYRKLGIENPDGLEGRKIASGERTRTLYYSWTPDVTKQGFSQWLEIDNTYEHGGSMKATDLWLDPDGISHLLWTTSPIALEYRDKYFPDIKRKWSMCYARVKDGKILLKKTLLETGEDVPKSSYNDFLENYSISFSRFQVLPDGRLFIIFYVSGTNKQGGSRSENRLMEVYNDGTAGISQVIPLKYPMSLFFTATPRGGSLPSMTIDMAGQGNDGGNKVRYARIQLSDN